MLPHTCSYNPETHEVIIDGQALKLGLYERRLFTELLFNGSVIPAEFAAKYGYEAPRNRMTGGSSKAFDVKSSNLRDKIALTVLTMPQRAAGGTKGAAKGQWPTKPVTMLFTPSGKELRL